jgi:hypothetical protein
VVVGWTFSDRPTTWLKLCDAPCRIACARLFSLSLVPASDPTLSTMEGGAEQQAPAVVDPILKSRISLRIGSGCNASQCYCLNVHYPMLAASAPFPISVFVLIYTIRP